MLSGYRIIIKQPFHSDFHTLFYDFLFLISLTKYSVLSFIVYD